MRIKIKRRIRTANSEQWSLFNTEELDDTGEPSNIGKVDIHYDPDMIYVTLLLWSEVTEELEETTIQRIIDDIIDEVTEPVGVPADYSLEFFTPSLSSYRFKTNYEEEEDLEDEEDEEGEEDYEERNGQAKWN